MEYYFYLDVLYTFLHYIYMCFTFLKSCLFPHIKKKRMKNDQQVRAELHLAKRCGGQNQKLQNLNFLEAELP